MRIKSAVPSTKRSPSMRREWIEMDIPDISEKQDKVSLHAEGVD